MSKREPAQAPRRAPAAELARVRRWQWEPEQGRRPLGPRQVEQAGAPVKRRGVAEEPAQPRRWRWKERHNRLAARSVFARRVPRPPCRWPQPTPPCASWSRRLARSVCRCPEVQPVSSYPGPQCSSASPHLEALAGGLTGADWYRIFCGNALSLRAGLAVTGTHSVVVSRKSTACATPSICRRERRPEVLEACEGYAVVEIVGDGGCGAGAACAIAAMYSSPAHLMAPRLTCRIGGTCS